MTTDKIRGIYTIDMTSTTQTLDFTYTMPPQTMILQSYRVEFTTSTTAKTAQVLFLKLPFLNSSNLIDNYKGKTRIPILVGGSQVNIQNACNMPIYVQGYIPNSYECSVELADGSVPVNFVRLTMIFELTEGKAVS